jgi:hypothetical protein
VLQFTSFELFRRLAYYLDANSSSNAGHVLHFTCGVCAGVTATAATFPMDVIRTFLVAQGEPKVGPSCLWVAVKTPQLKKKK